MRKKCTFLLLFIIIILCVGYAFSKYVFFSEQDVTVILKDATINETQIVINPNGWTKDKVTVTIESDKDGEIYYKVGESGDWTKYSSPFDVFENDTVYSKLVFNDGSGPETLKDITNIDKIPPTETAPSATSTTRQVNITCNQIDKESGIDESTIEYGIFIDGEWIWSKSPIFNELQQDTEYKIKTRVMDITGNGPTESIESTIKTKKISESTLTFKKDNNEGDIINFKNIDDYSVWVNTNIYITVNESETEGVTTSYKIVDENGTEQILNSEGVLITNTGKYIATIKTSDGINEKIITYYLYIDKTTPKITINPNGGSYFIPVGSEDINVTTTIYGEDDGGSNIKNIQYSWSTSNITEPETWNDIQNNEEISKTLVGGTHYIWTKITDNAGNVKTEISSGFKIGYTVEYDSNGGNINIESQQKEHNVNIALSDEITRIGYNFIKWNTSADGNGISYTKSQIYEENKSIKLYAIWEAKTYNIVYDLNGGTITDNNEFEEYETYTYNLEKQLPTKEDVSKPGYELDYWIDEKGNQYTSLPVGTIEDIKLIAHWKPTTATYTVYHYVENINDENYTLESTDSNIEGITESTLVLENLKKTIMGTTYKQGSITKDGNPVLTTNINGDSSTTIYLYYTRNKYTLTVNKNENIGNTYGTGTYKYGATVKISAELANLPGYNYKWEGWSSNDITVPTEQTADITIPDKNITITANASKEIIEYSISYNLDGGNLKEGVTNPTSYNVETVDFTLNNPIKTGYTFVGWDDGTGNINNNVTISVGTIGEKTYTAKWEINSYKVIYDYTTNGGNSSTINSDVLEYNSQIDLSPTATKTGYTFIGWNTDKNATIGLTNLKMETSDITLYAIFEKEVTVTFKANGGNEDITQKYKIYNNETELNITTPSEPTTYSNWEFLCYGINASDTSGYSLNESITALVEINQSTVTYYTNWKKDINVKFIDYKENVKTITETNVVAYNSETTSVTAPAQNIYTNWIPKGWTTSTTTYAVGTNVNGGTYTEIINDTVYYGLYEQNIELTYNLNGGISSQISSQIGTRKVNSSYIDRITNPVLKISETTPTKQGYEFVNWKDDLENIYEPNKDYTFTKSTQINAIWNIITYNIVYDLAGGNLEEGVTNPSTYTVETETITLNNPIKTGYIFTGWQLEGETTISNPCYINKGSIGNKKYIAIWDNGIDTKYKIEYYYQQNGIYPETATSSNIKTGTTDDLVTVTNEDKTPTQTGYTLDLSANNIFEGTIASDGSLVLKVYFKQQFTVTYKAGTHVSFEEEVYTGLDYGAETPEFKGTPIIDAGYENGVWTPTITETVTNNITYIFNSTIPKTDTPYKIEYYYQTNGTYSNTPTITDETRVGTTDTVITLSSGDKTPTKEGYTYDNNAANITTGKIAGDGSLVLKVYFKQQFTVTYKAGSNVNFEDDVYTNLDYGTKTPEFNSEITYAPGYSDGNWEPQIAETVTSDITYILNATANTNTKYKVEYYYQQNGTYLNTPTNTDETRTGTTDTTVSIIDSDKVPVQEGYVFDEKADNILSGNIAGDESLTLKIYFKQQFTVEYLPGEKGTFKEEKYQNLDYGITTPQFSGKITGKVGYTFEGWNPKIENTVTKNIKYTANWTANSDTSYTIEYYYQSQENGQYLEEPTQKDKSRTGTTDTIVDITDEINNNIPSGYALDNSKTNILSGIIAGDGSLVLKVYYKLQYTVTYTAGNKTTFDDEVYSNLDYGTKTPNFEGTINYSAGYGNGEWTPTIKETVTSNTTYTFNAIANTDTKYKVEYYYQQNGNYSDSSLSYGEIRTGTTDTKANVTEIDKTPIHSGYIFDENADNILSGNIEGDGTLTLKIYFKQQFTVKYTPGEKGTFEELIFQNLDYGEKTPTFTGSTTGLPGYTFNKWDPIINDTVTQDVTYTAVYTANTNTPYTIHIYGENANDTGYTFIKDVVKTGTTDTQVNIENIKDKLENYGEDTIIAKDAINGNTITNITIKGDGTSELYLYYSRNKYKLNLAKGENIKKVTGDGTYKWGQSVQISAEIEDDSGNTYNWLNWTSSNTALIDNQLDQTTTITMPIIPENETLTLTANATATPNEYSITYNNLKGADNSKNPNTYNYGQTILLQAPGTIEGYDFEGWYTDKNFTTQKTQILSTDKQNLTIYAKWNVHKYSVTYNAMGGTCDTGIIENVEYGSQIDVTNIIAKKPNYVFKGWATSENATTPLESLTMGEGNVTLYAIYVEAVAQIGNEYFETLQDAINYAGTTPSTIIMLKSVTTSGISGNISAGQDIILNLNGKTIQSSNNTTINNNGTLEITGDGNVNATGSGCNAIINNGTTTIKGGTIKTTGENSSTNTDTIVIKSGKVTINGGNIIAEKAAGIVVSNGDLEIIKGNVEAKSYGVWCSTTNKGTITIGTNDSTVSVTAPSIIGGSYGISVGTSTFNYYDGVIKGSTGKSITGTVSATPTGYGVHKTTENNIETAILVPANYAEYTSSGTLVNYYTTLADATTMATSGNTIKPLVNRSETTAVTVASGKTLTIDLNGKTVTLNGISITNNGTLTITGSSGTLTSSVNTIINGSSSNSSATFTKSGACTITGTGASYSTINNYGVATFSAGTVSSTNYRAIYNQATGKITASGATISAAKYAIYNIGTANTTTSPAVKVTGGTIKSTESNTIYNNSAGMIYLTGGTAKQENENTVIFNNSTGTIQVSGATVQSTGTAGHAIRNGDSSTGTIKITSGNISSSANHTIYGFGTITVTGGTVSTTSESAIYSEGTLTVSGGTVQKSGTATGACIVYNGTGTATISGGTIKVLSGSASNVLYNSNSGTITISGATVQQLGTGCGVTNEGTGTINLTSGSITSTSNRGINNVSTGKIQVSGGTITGGSYGIYIDKGTGIISGGTIESVNQGIYISTGTCTVTKGTITSSNASGIGVYGGTLTIGTNESTPSVSTTVPSITGGTYGVYVNSDGKFNFYDGVLKGADGKSMSKQPAAIPTGYGVKKTTSNSIETAILVKAYTVSYNANGGSGAPSSQTKLEGVTLTLSTTKPTRSGYTFKGWGTSSTATSVSYASGASYTSNAAITLYAIWEGTATFDLNYLDSTLWTDTYLTSKYGSAGTSPSSKTTVSDNTCKYGQYIEFTMPSGTSGGPYYSNSTALTVGSTYTWSVFIKASSAKTLKIGPEQGGTKTVNVTTNWQKITYTFTATENQYKAFVFYLSGSTWSSGNKLYIHSLEIMEGTPTTKSTKSVICNATLGTLSTPTRTGYTFKGWYTAPVRWK